MHSGTSEEHASRTLLPPTMALSSRLPPPIPGIYPTSHRARAARVAVANDPRFSTLWTCLFVCVHAHISIPFSLDIPVDLVCVPKAISLRAEMDRIRSTPNLAGLIPKAECRLHLTDYRDAPEYTQSMQVPTSPANSPLRRKVCYRNDGNELS